VALDQILALPQVREKFAAALDSAIDPFAAAFSSFGLKPLSPAGAIPAQGALMVVANHPFGGPDALALGSLCMQARPDVLLLANQMAAEIPVLRSVTLPLSILGGESAARINAASLRKALAHLKAGGCLAVFPSGEVASRKGRHIMESPWSSHIAALAQRTQIPILPVRFYGHNPFWFHLLGEIHPLIRTALLPRLLLQSAGKRMDFQIGEITHPQDHSDLTAEEFARFLQSTTMGLKCM